MNQPEENLCSTRASVNTSALASDGTSCEFDYLDQPSFRKLYANEAVPPQMSFFVEGLHCSACIWRIENLAQKLEGVQSLRVSLGENLVEVTLEPHGSFAAVARRLSELGYKPHPLLPDNLATQALKKKENRNHLVRLGIAGACTGNIMLLSVSMYAGLDGPMGTLFSWLTFVLFLPVLLYSAQPFFVNSWRAIRQKNTSIDIPIVSALVLGGALSFYHLLVGSGEIYFDSLSTLVFLLLSSRYLLKRIQQNFLSPSYLLPFFATDQVRAWDETKGCYQLIPFQDLQPGQKILVQKNERLPADGQLLSASAHLNMAILTGESLPQRVCQNNQVFAGTDLLSDPIEIRVSHVGESSRMGQLLKEMEKQALSRSPLVSLTDRLGQWFALSVLAIGLLFFLFYSFVDLTEAVNRALALVILACPCALALATPLTQSLSLARAIRQGIVIKKAEALERLAQIKDVIFDKTGTLTEGNFRVTSWSPQFPDEWTQSAIVALERKSEHPIAKALVNELDHKNLPHLEVDQWTEEMGRGVQGWIGNDKVEIKGTLNPEPPLPQLQAQTQIEVIKNHQKLVDIALGDRIRPEAHKVIQQIEALGLHSHLLSGDSLGAVHHVAQELGLSLDRVRGQQSPEQKLQYVQSFPQALMVGDGANDAVAMAGSSVSLAVHGSMEASLKAADVYVTRPSLQQVTQLIEISKETMKVIRRNLGISFVYNLMGSIAALLGWVNPLVAAVLMPLSSALVLLSSVWGTGKLRQENKEKKGSKLTALISPAPMTESSV